MVKTYGLTHLAMNVKDLRKSFHFYHSLFGVEEVYSTSDRIEFRTPGAKDVIDLLQGDSQSGTMGGLEHIGFRLIDPRDFEPVVAQVEPAGGRILEQGEFAPGCPYAYVADPDGYVLEIWFEP
ncbi:hypothetical protein CH373_11210 [Leptospira perolatii]|uniref:VOC domain-containing protein n=1 Tax=Leptospira perolatii TaxID=2023191 RepID=A0A2M9ZLU6_9LEPT|nr:VOC family protein [Leptospira perolatii]PJZ69729.1 hypothetical protein CH360_09025 [Leptospira perolatii]PJZ73056.1 hypothetical protein CH373_11210 [Leptospira perolatii]